MKEKVVTLKKNYEFKRVLSKGKYYVGKQIIVYIKQNSKKENNIGIAINTRLCHAFMRNRLKRLIRESYRCFYCDLKKGYDIVFLWNKNTNPKEANLLEIKNDMSNCFFKVKIFKEEIKN
jgi:ribonuclease P protein component